MGLRAYVAGVVVFIGSLIAAARTLPDRVPLHYDIHGDPDNWASRGDALMTIGIIGFAVAGVFGLFAVLSTRIPIGMVNVPDRDWWAATPEREAELRRRMRTDMFGFGGGVLLFFALVTGLTTRAAEADPPHLDGWFAAVLGLFVLGVLGWVVYAVRVRYRRTEASSGAGDH